MNLSVPRLRACSAHQHGRRSYIEVRLPTCWAPFQNGEGIWTLRELEAYVQKTFSTIFSKVLKPLALPVCKGAHRCSRSFSAFQTRRQKQSALAMKIGKSSLRSSKWHLIKRVDHEVGGQLLFLFFPPHCFKEERCSRLCRAH